VRIDSILFHLLSERFHFYYIFTSYIGNILTNFIFLNLVVFEILLLSKHPDKSLKTFLWISTNILLKIVHLFKRLSILLIRSFSLLMCF
jgi:hypothetical protein